MRLELTRANAHYPLKVARLPIPPSGHCLHDFCQPVAFSCFGKNGAKNGTRTRDPDLGKVVLYQLSYFRRCCIDSDGDCGIGSCIMPATLIKCSLLSEKRDSNPRPRPWQGRALPTELFSQSTLATGLFFAFALQR